MGLRFGSQKVGTDVAMRQDLFYSEGAYDETITAQLFTAPSGRLRSSVLPAHGSVTCSQFVDVSPLRLGRRVKTPAQIEIAPSSDSVADQSEVERDVLPFADASMIRTLAVASGQSTFEQIGPVLQGVPENVYDAEHYTNELFATRARRAQHSSGMVLCFTCPSSPPCMPATPRLQARQTRPTRCARRSIRQ